MTHTALLLLLPLALATPTRAGPLHDAARSGDVSRVEQLVGQGADVNARGNNDATPLLVAALEGHRAVVELLIDQGANINARNKGGLTPLHAAAYQGHMDVVELLLAKGAKINDANNRFGITPLHAAAEQAHEAVADRLIAKGAKTDLKEVNGYTPLSRASFREHMDMIKVLKRHGATCQPADVTGDYTYQLCVKAGD